MTTAAKYLALASETREAAMIAATTVKRLEAIERAEDNFVAKMVLHRARTSLLELHALEQELRYAAQTAGGC